MTLSHLAASQEREAFEDSAAYIGWKELVNFRAALRRFDDGTYGKCANCGAPICYERLQVQSAARARHLAASNLTRGRGGRS